MRCLVFRIISKYFTVKIDEEEFEDNKGSNQNQSIEEGETTQCVLRVSINSKIDQDTNPYD